MRTGRSNQPGSMRPNNPKEDATEQVQRNRDVEDRREFSRPVRPGSGGPRGARLPRGGAR